MTISTKTNWTTSLSPARLSKTLLPLLITVAASSQAMESEHISLARSLTVDVCNTQSQCKTSDDKQDGTADIKLSSFHKGNARGLHGTDKALVTADNIPFKSEIFVNKTKSGYSIYAVLRSGQGTKRNGVTKRIDVLNISEFSSISLADKPFEIAGKQYRAKLEVGPVRTE